MEENNFLTDFLGFLKIVLHFVENCPLCAAGVLVGLLDWVDDDDDDDEDDGDDEAMEKVVFQLPWAPSNLSPYVSWPLHCPTVHVMLPKNLGIFHFTIKS